MSDRKVTGSAKYKHLPEDCCTCRNYLNAELTYCDNYENNSNYVYGVY